MLEQLAPDENNSAGTMLPHRLGKVTRFLESGQTAIEQNEIIRLD